MKDGKQTCLGELFSHECPWCLCGTAFLFIKVALHPYKAILFYFRQDMTSSVHHTTKVH